MSVLADLSLSSRIILFTLLVLMGLFTGIVYWAQVGCVRGRPFENPDGDGEFLVSVGKRDDDRH